MYLESIFQRLKYRIFEKNDHDNFNLASSYLYIKVAKMRDADFFD